MGMGVLTGRSCLASPKSMSDTWLSCVTKMLVGFRSLVMAGEKFEVLIYKGKADNVLSRIRGLKIATN